jgi:hypothetical protein
VPRYISKCHEDLWREFNNLTLAPVVVKIGVQLPYTKQSFTGALRASFEKSVAETAGLLISAISQRSSNSISPSLLPLISPVNIATIEETFDEKAAAAVQITCSVRVPRSAGTVEKAEDIRNALTVRNISARLAANGVESISEIFQDALVVWPNEETDPCDTVPYAYGV